MASQTGKSAPLLKAYPMPALRLLTAKEAAALLTVSLPTFYRLIRRGDISTVRIGGSVRFRESDLLEYIDRQTSRAGGSSHAE